MSVRRRRGSSFSEADLERDELLPKGETLDGNFKDPKDADAEDDDAAPGAGAFGTIINICKNVVGSGLLNLPKTLIEGTPIISLPLLFVVGGFNAFTFWLTGIASEGKYNGFGKMWQAKVGGAAWIIDLTLIANGVLTTSGYITIICALTNGSLNVYGDEFKNPPERFTSERLLYMAPTAILAILPLCLLKDLSVLKIPSLIGLAFTAFTIFFVIGDWLRNGLLDNQPAPTQTMTAAQMKIVNPPGEGGLFDAFKNSGDPSLKTTLQILSLFTSSYAAHYNAPKFYCELSDASPSKFLWISLVSYGLVAVIFGAFATAGYGRFGNQTGLLDNGEDGGSGILDTYSGSAKKGIENLVCFAYVGILMSTIASYPIIFSAPRIAIAGWFGREVDSMSLTARATLASIFISVTVLIGWSGISLTAVNQLKGSTATIFLTGILPAVVVIATARNAKKSTKKKEDPGKLSLNLMPERINNKSPLEAAAGTFKCVGYGVLATSISLMVIGLYLMLYDSLPVSLRFLD